MKKVFILIFTLAVTILLSSVAYATEAGKGALRIHLQQWEDEYADNLGSHGWEGLPQTVKYTGKDDFGVYWDFDDLDVNAEGHFGFIAVEWVNGAAGTWPADGARERRTADVRINKNIIIEGQTVHVYLFEGVESLETAETPSYFVAKNDRQNVMLIFADPTSTYSDKIGLHAWGWENTPNGWADPNLVFVDAANYGAIKPIKGVMLHSVAEGFKYDDHGFIVYEGGDANKRTNDVKNFIPADTPLGTVTFRYVVDAGAGKTDNSNVYTDKSLFVTDAFTFRLQQYKVDATTGEGSGTYAVNPTQIKVSLSAAVAIPFAVRNDSELKQAKVKSWFTVREVLGENTYGDPLEIERVDFASSAVSLIDFVIILKDTNKLNVTKEYELFFNYDLEEPVPLAEEKEIKVTFRGKVPAGTPAEAVIHLGANFTNPAWDPEHADTKATLVSGTTDTYEFVYTFSTKNAVTIFEYKWTRGSWGSNEYLDGGNRRVVIATGNEQTEYVFDDTIISWEDLAKAADPDAKGTPAPQDRLPLENVVLQASILVDMDKEAPVLTFTSPIGILGKPEAERIIIVKWGEKFNTALFPRFRVTDNRDGELTNYVFVPKGNFSVLDTSVEGDYIIMLEVSDLWGNVTQEKFTFRVQK